jgi:hypothetical protein
VITLAKTIHKATVVLIAILAIGATFVSSASANSPVISEMPTGMTVTVKERNVTPTKYAVATKNFVILSFIKAHGLSKKVVDHSKCRMIGAGTNVPEYTNSGYTANGELFKFADTRRTEVCMTEGQWRKVICGNNIWFSVSPKVFHGKVIMVRSWKHVKFTIHVVAKVKATGSCGYAYASAKVTQRVDLKLFAKSKGAAAIRIYARVIDKATAKAKAEVFCETTVTVIPTCTCHEKPGSPCNCPPPQECPSGSVPNEKGECVKDGSTTPQPPSDAPGPNPPDEGGVGSNQCYSETTGQPVPPREGLCPPGSYGG